MAHLIFHAGAEGKATRQNAKGMARHTQRKTKGTKNHSNKDIDKERTKYNIEMTAKGKTADEVIEERLENEYRGKRKLRKDQVVLREVITQPSPEFFEGMTIEEKRESLKRFMSDSLPWFAEEFGAKNIVGASGHLDETNPHVHFMIMPMTKDGRVSQTEFFTGPKDLQRQHKEYRQHMVDKGWDFELENKYENIDNVPLPKFKANAKEITEKRDAQQQEIESLMENDDIHEQAISRFTDEKGHLIREYLDEREEEIKKREVAVKKREEQMNKRMNEREERLDIQKMDFMRQLADVSRGYASEESTKALDGFVEQGYFVEEPRVIRSVIDETVQGAVRKSKTKELQQHSRTVAKQEDDFELGR